MTSILTAHYLPRDAEVAGHAIAKLNAYRLAKSQTGVKPLQNAVVLKGEKAL